MSGIFQEDLLCIQHIHIFNYCFRLGHFPASWKKAKILTVPESGRDSKFPPNLRPISLLCTTGKFFQKLILRKIQKHIKGRNLLNANQFGFRADRITTLQFVRLADHVTLNLNKNMSTANVFLDIEKAFDKIRYSCLLYK
jgi:hypothetical protein